MQPNQKAWKLKHQLITESIIKTGDFSLEKINRKVKEALGYDEDTPQEENKENMCIVGALKKVLK